MSYRVEYPSSPEPPKSSQRRIRPVFLSSLFFLVFLAIIGCSWPHGRAVLRKLLLPGDPAVTAAALENLALELKSGAGLSYAIASFCRKILQGAGIVLG